MDPAEAWIERIPHSRIAYPTSILERLKHLLWHFLTPMHPYTRGFMEWVGFVDWRYKKYRLEGRQKYLIGRLAKSETAQSLASYLVEQGYGNHFVALKDKGEIIGLRHTPTFKHQYHIRIFDDGEVRGHFEYTPECHPYLHDIAADVEERREYFLKLLEGKIIPS